MAYSIKWRPKSISQLRKLPKDIAIRIVNKVDSLKETPLRFLEKLINDHGFKLRVGDYRIIIDLIEEDKILTVRIVAHRKNIYERYL